MSQYYEPEFKQQIVRLHIEEGRTYRSLTAEYGVSKASISKWCKEFSEECRQNALKNPTARNDLELMKGTAVCGKNSQMHAKKIFS